MTSLSGADETLVIGESVLNVSEEVVRHFLMPLFMRRLLATTPSLLKFKSSYTVRGMSTRLLLFEEVCSTDFLSFSFGGRGYSDQLTDAIAKTGELAGARVELLQVPGAQPVVWVSHNFGFLGGSLGCAEGEKITRAFEYGLEHQLPVVVQCRSGGARMQEGTSSLMQMAKISVAVDALRRASLPFVAVLRLYIIPYQQRYITLISLSFSFSDPTYGGVSASYAMQADIKIAVEDARIGFAGPQVILNTMCDADQGVFDSQCPPDFQSAAYVLEHGQLDIVLKGDQSKQAHIEQYVTSICTTLLRNKSSSSSTSLRTSIISSLDIPETDKSTPFNYTRSRKIDRPQTQDIIGSLFDDFVELSGDSRVGRDCCIRGRYFI
jgi:acetyl-CoA carboxylase beta subunit